jgi:DNA adenine methylase
MVAKLLPLVPQGGRPYCEPYCGGASLFFAREPAPVEVLNDLDERVVNLFRCLQDREKFEELRHRIMYTPYAMAEFKRAIERIENGAADDVDKAWATFVLLNQGMNGMYATTPGNWSRTFIHRGGVADATNKWLMRLSMLHAFHLRLMMVQIDCRDAIDVIRYWDNPDAVFYVDPPYHPDTRVTRSIYAIEPGHDHHERLVQTLLECKGAVVLSCYDHPVYMPLIEAGWERHEFKTACYAAGRVRGSGLRGKGSAMKKVPRVEVVLRNPKAAEMAPVDSPKRRPNLRASA